MSVDTAPAPAPAAAAVSRGARPAPEARPFDFRHPSTLSRDDARALQVLQETVAHGLATMLASAVRASIDVKIDRIDQTPHAEMIRRSPNPSSISVLRLEPLGVPALLRIDPELSYTLVELLLGGPGTGPHPERAHTEVEEALVAGLVDRIRPTIDEAFHPIVPVESKLVAQESNPSFVQIASATDMVVSIGLDVGVDEIRGGVQLIVPAAALRPHLDALSTDQAETPRPAAESAAIAQQVVDHLSGVDVTAAARFEAVLASSKDLMDLAVGDVLALDHQLDAPLVLELDGVPVHEVAVGRVRRNYAVEVVGPSPAVRRRLNRLTRLAPDAASDD